MPILPYHCKACGQDFEIWRRDPDAIGEVQCAVCESEDVEAKPHVVQRPRVGFIQVVGTVSAHDGDEAARKVREGEMIPRTEEEALAELEAALAQDEDAVQPGEPDEAEVPEDGEDEGSGNGHDRG